MSKTVRLTSTYQNYRPGTILTLADTIADALLLGGVGATLDLTGGVLPPAAPDTGPTDLPTKVQVSSDGKTKTLVDGNGNTLAQLPLSRINGPKKIVAAGDSLVDYGDRFGRLYNDPTVLNFIITKGATIDTPAGNGTLTWNRESRTLQWAAFGETAGAPIYIAGSGIYTLPSSVPGHDLRVGCKSFTMDATPSGSEVLTPSGTPVAWLKSPGGFMHILDAITGHRFQIRRNFGISGISAFEAVGNMMDQVCKTDADIVNLVIGTNDIQLRNRTADQTAADIVACWDQLGAAGKVVMGNLISPRWGHDPTGGTTGLYTDNTKFSATLQARITNANRQLIIAARSRPWVRIVDVWRTTTDGTQTDGRVKNGYTKDGLHDNGGLAYERALRMRAIVNAMYPDDSFLINVGAGSYYDAVNNPGGNLLTPNQGAFAGTGGTAGAGITVGTGLAAQLTAARLTGAAVVATANKVAATDGGQDWQEFVVSGATALHETFRILFGNIPFANVAVGDLIEFAVEFQVIGSGCSGIYTDIFGASSGFQPSAQSVQSIMQGLRDGETGVIATEPFAIQAGSTAINPRLYFTSLIGANFTIRFRNADLRKILAP